MDFFVRDANSLIPVEIKSNDNATASLNNLLKNRKIPRCKIWFQIGIQEYWFQWQVLYLPVLPDILAKKVPKFQSCHNGIRKSQNLSFKGIIANKNVYIKKTDIQYS